MSVQKSKDEMFGPVEVVLAGRRFREEFAGVKIPDFADWMQEECQYINDDVPLLPLELVEEFEQWANERRYEVRVKPGVRRRLEGGLDE